MRHVIGATCVLAGLAIGATARADDEQALEVYERATAHARAGDWDRACPLFEWSSEMSARGATLFWVAECQRRRGDALGAYRTYERVRDMARKASRAQVEQEAERHLADLDARLPKLTITVEAEHDPYDMHLAVDGEQVAAGGIGQPIRLSPGEHRVEASAPGHAPSVIVVKLAPGSARTVHLSLDAATPAPRDEPKPVPDTISAPETTPSYWPTVALASFAVGAAGAVTFGVAGAVWLQQDAELAPHCRNGACPANLADRVAAMDRSAAAAWLGAGIGGAGILMGVTALLLDEAIEAPVSVQVGMSGIEISGSF